MVQLKIRNMPNHLTSLRKKWHKELYQYLESQDLLGCEWPGCGSSLGLAAAHGKKRRFIHTREEYFRAVLLCQTHHHYVEYGNNNEPGTHERMDIIIQVLLDTRGWSYTAKKLELDPVINDFSIFTVTIKPLV